MSGPPSPLPLCQASPSSGPSSHLRCVHACSCPSGSLFPPTSDCLHPPPVSPCIPRSPPGTLASPLPPTHSPADISRALPLVHLVPHSLCLCVLPPLYVSGSPLPLAPSVCLSLFPILCPSSHFCPPPLSHPIPLSLGVSIPLSSALTALAASPRLFPGVSLSLSWSKVDPLDRLAKGGPSLPPFAPGTHISLGTFSPSLSLPPPQPLPMQIPGDRGHLPGSHPPLPVPVREWGVGAGLPHEHIADGCSGHSCSHLPHGPPTTVRLRWPQTPLTCPCVSPPPGLMGHTSAVW